MAKLNTYKIARLAIRPDDDKLTNYYNKAGGLHVGHLYYSEADYDFLVLRDNDMREYLACRHD